MNFLRQLWASVRSNPVFVAFEGGAYGAILDFVYDAGTTGHLDFTAAGFRKLMITAVTGGVVAVRLLYRNAPGATPNATK